MIDTAGPTAPPARRAKELRRGDRVRVRPAAEIVATLDEAGDRENLPFMPEMLPLCGGTYTVAARADKTCDTVNLLGCNRTMTDTVHLVGLRCDGSAHGGCQATQLLDATAPMASGDLAQYLRDVRTRNVALWPLARALAYIVANKYQALSVRFLPARLRIAGGASLPVLRGTLDRTPTERLDLAPGEIVEIRGRDEILATLDKRLRNRGMLFDVEMLRYCGRRARVLRRVTKIIDEKTGRMLPMKNDCIVLDEVVCTGDYHRLCRRAVYPYWREIWLRRVGEPVISAEAGTKASAEPSTKAGTETSSEAAAFAGPAEPVLGSTGRSAP